MITQFLFWEMVAVVRRMIVVLCLVLLLAAVAVSWLWPAPSTAQGSVVLIDQPGVPMAGGGAGGGAGAAW